MGEKIGIGVIGIGFGQYVHVPAFRMDPRCEVRAICATTIDRARHVSNQLGIAKAYGDPGELIADASIDVVSMAVPPYLQPALIESAARAGKHVFCEKPLGISSEEVMPAVNAARQANVRTAVNLIFPENVVWQKAKRSVAEVGRIRQAVLSWRVETRAYRDGTENWKTSLVQGGGTLLNLVSHTAYYLEWLFGRTTSLMAFLRGAPVDAGVEAWLKIDNIDVTVSVNGDSYAGSGHRLEVYGESGTLLLRNETNDYVNGFELLTANREQDRLMLVVSQGESNADGRISATAAIVTRLIDSIINNSTSIPNLEDGLRVQQLLDAMRRSHESGRWVSV